MSPPNPYTPLSIARPARAPLARLVRPLAIAALVLCFVVVALGAYVRLTAAGLGCPDWPGCYGHVTPVGAEHSATAQAAFPQRPLDVGKAWREMIHRYAASTLGLLILALSAIAIVTRRQRIMAVSLALALLATVLLQGLLGMLTVTWQLKPLVVTAHLLFGLSTLGLLWWLVLSLSGGGSGSPQSGLPQTGLRSSTGSQPLPLARICTSIALAMLVVQIALGGWTSSNYAAISCPDFPQCQHAWWPPADFRDAFVLWRGLDVDYEGGVLGSPARIAIHLTHRLGALAATLALCAAALTVLRGPSSSTQRLCGAGVLAALALQLTLGISMVLQGFPLLLATAHTAGAALLLLATLALLRSVVANPGPRAFW